MNDFFDDWILLQETFKFLIYPFWNSFSFHSKSIHISISILIILQFFSICKENASLLGTDSWASPANVVLFPEYS